MRLTYPDPFHLLDALSEIYPETSLIVHRIHEPPTFLSDECITLIIPIFDKEDTLVGVDVRPSSFIVERLTPAQVLNRLRTAHAMHANISTVSVQSAELELLTLLSTGSATL